MRHTIPCENRIINFTMILPILIVEPIINLRLSTSETNTRHKHDRISMPLPLRKTLFCLILVSTYRPCHSLMKSPSTGLTVGRRRLNQCSSSPSSSSFLTMVLEQDPLNSSWSKTNNAKRYSLNPTERKRRKKYERKRIPVTERERKRISIERQRQYEQIQKTDGTAPSIWSFESIFPKPVRDVKIIDQDLYGVSRRDHQLRQKKLASSSSAAAAESPQLSLHVDKSSVPKSKMKRVKKELTNDQAQAQIFKPTFPSSTLVEKISSDTSNKNATTTTTSVSEQLVSTSTETNISSKVDFTLTRMVEDRLFGYRRGTSLYETSLIGDGAVKFREGVRLGNPLRVNADRLNYHAKKEIRSNRLEEAQELYEMAIQIDPRDGRAYLGLSKCAERRRDFKLARECLRIGISQSVSCASDSTPDVGANPFLMQALGCLEEKTGHLSEAESLYISAVRSRPSHAASWVALAQLRTRKFRQGAAAGRVCYQAAERELEKVGMPPSSYVYTAWASMEYKKCGDSRRAKKLFKAALTVDKKCSAAWLQLGVMEADLENWEQSELCFETVLKFDQRNSRVIQAYAIMESKRPDSNSRKVINLFERALKANSRDAGVLQPYGLYVAKLGDIDSARDLLRRATQVNKRHAAAWQAWGVMETRNGNPEEARNIFQQGIWACAQLTGGQSGGYSCARLWQGWGVLEASEGDFAAARRCFSRALDADTRNLAAITAWTHMEENIGNLSEARHLFKQLLQKFTPGTDETKQLWRAYELMEQRAGNEANAQEVYRQSMRESYSAVIEEQRNSASSDYSPSVRTKDQYQKTQLQDDEDGQKRTPKIKREFEVSRWDQGSSSMKAEMMMDGSIEGMVPKSTLNKRKKKHISSTSTSKPK
mmetsp:Transcript_53596/g.59900  ORF Transcript_53596/g.59900 Transcript_53596/m.59900 type:complete len:880 (-) Transcript_53596:132-2771(-)